LLQRDEGDPEFGDGDPVWKTVARTRLSARSRFVFKVMGSGYYHVYRPADADNVAGLSEEFSITP
jgi:hypothetical protein